MKANKVSIVVFGHDEHLLATRQWVLQSRGYRVFTVSDASRLATIAPNLPVKLIIVCHSVSAEECAAVMALSTARWPSIEHLVLDADGSRMPDGLLGQLLHTMDGPAKLLSVVNEIIGKRLPATGT